ncbi:MmcQ/YjbR family DNA-binding protein [Caulobacter zeae]|uniref:MmcQ/YjbR family DNA-binding protein n=1 Tax=Caulobacter zeae TaxID=2055137 RepID=UPI001F0B7C5F|nr:MmcQ/YjbR family DNA-binding protein [Caulobacter zeae]
MVDDETLRALATALPEVIETSNGQQVAYEVRGKGLAWGYLARPAPKAKRVLVPGVIAVRCLIETKQMLIEAAPERFFDDDHYRGFPAVLVRLAAIETDELAGLLRTAWTIVASRSLVKAPPKKGSPRMSGDVRGDGSSQ